METTFIYQFNLSTPWNISSISTADIISSNLSLSFSGYRSNKFSFSNSGTKMFFTVTGSAGGGSIALISYDLLESWNVSQIDVSSLKVIDVVHSHVDPQKFLNLCFQIQVDI